MSIDTNRSLQGEGKTPQEPVPGRRGSRRSRSPRRFRQLPFRWASGLSPSDKLRLRFLPAQAPSAIQDLAPRQGSQAAQPARIAVRFPGAATAPSRTNSPLALSMMNRIDTYESTTCCFSWRAAKPVRRNSGWGKDKPGPHPSPGSEPFEKASMTPISAVVRGDCQGVLRAVAGGSPS